jgi:hypothetical protein
MHEHVFIMTTEIAENYPEAWGNEEQRVADVQRVARQPDWSKGVALQCNTFTPYDGPSPFDTGHSRTQSMSGT